MDTVKHAHHFSKEIKIFAGHFFFQFYGISTDFWNYLSWYAASKFWLVFFLVLLFKTVTVCALSNANKVPTFSPKSLILSSSEPKAALSMERLHCPSLSYVRPQFQSTSLLKSLLPIVTKFYIKHLKLLFIWSLGRVALRSR